MAGLRARPKLDLDPIVPHCQLTLYYPLVVLEADDCLRDKYLMCLQHGAGSVNCSGYTLGFVVATTADSQQANMEDEPKE
jgi:hypothetical protein